MKVQPLSGSDYFHLLIDRKMLRNGLVGNISRYHLQLEPAADLNLIAQHLSKNETLDQVSRLKVALRWPLIPKWQVRDCFSTGDDNISHTKTNKKLPHRTLQIHKDLSADEFENIALNRKVDNETGLIFIDLCVLIDGSKHVVVSMHHVLFDHQGMTNFLISLNFGAPNFPFFPDTVRTSVWLTIPNAFYMTVYMLWRSSGKLGTLLDVNVKPKSIPKFTLIEFNQEETKLIEANAWKAGSRIGQSAFYMAVVAISVNQATRERNKESPYLWFSVPHNRRRKGSAGHLVSNQLSFLFFRLRKAELLDVEASISAINLQLKQQVKERIIDRYSNLMDFLRLMPLSVYERMVDLASSGKMSSFGYSDLGENKQPINEFVGANVLRMDHYPPVPSPPGFNVIVSKADGQLKFVWAYFDEVISKDEIRRMEEVFRNQLLIS